VLGSTETTVSDEEVRLARNELLLYFADLSAKRRDSPQSDLVSMLATVTVDGEPLTDAEIVLNCYSVILGGDETTRLTMTGAVLALIEHPDQWRALRAGGVDPTTATEEVLRWTCVPAHVGRSARRDVTLCGRKIAAGDPLTGWLWSANRDEDVFGDPDRFDLGRTPNRHLSFGHGPHFCLGAHLARAQIGALLTELSRQVAQMEVCGPVGRIYSNFFQGVGSLPVVLTAAAS
jgi:cytochrome P450